MSCEVYIKNKYKGRRVKGSLKPLYSSHYVEWRTKWEMALTKSSARIRSDPDWMEKLEDADQVNKWLDTVKNESRLSQEYLDFLVAELKYYARLQRANNVSGTKLSGVDMVWTMDIDDDEALAQEFRRNVVNVLESAPSEQHDCLRSNYKVHHLISPSLYPLLFNKSSLLERPVRSPLEALHVPSFGRHPGFQDSWINDIQALNQRMANESDFIPFNESYLRRLNTSDRHWLPTDIHVNDDGSVDFKSYINNLHPGTHTAAYKAIAKVIAKCIPALEQVLTDWKDPRILRVPYVSDTCVKERRPHPSEDRDLDRCDSDFDSDEAESNWEFDLEYNTPTPEAFDEPDRPLIPHSLRNKDLQVIVKMDNLFTYPGYLGRFDESYLDEQTWEGDGTASEQIIATAVYYYDVENPTDISVAFREGITFNRLYSPVEHKQVEYLFEPKEYKSRHSIYEQMAGEVKIKQGMVICYPNVYQHNLKGFYSCDPTKPSHIKALTLYFVKPSVRIISTSVVAPQQRDWWLGEIAQTPLMKNLPLLIRDQIIKQIDMPMPFDQALAIRKKLDDRSRVLDNSFEGIDRYKRKTRFVISVKKRSHY